MTIVNSFKGLQIDEKKTEIVNAGMVCRSALHLNKTHIKPVGVMCDKKIYVLLLSLILQFAFEFFDLYFQIFIGIHKVRNRFAGVEYSCVVFSSYGVSDSS